MNQALKRIEEALNQLETRKNAANPIANSTKSTYSFNLHSSKSNSFTQTKAAVLERGSAGETPAGLTPPFSAFSPKLPNLNAATNNLPTEQTSLDSLPEDLEFGAKKIESQLGDKKIRAGERVAGGILPPAISHFNPTDPLDTHNKLTDQACPNFSSHTSQQASYPDPGTQVEKSQNKPAPFFKASPPVVEHTDQTKLDLIVRQIQELYHSGPIVDGTLEYYPPSPESSDEIREVCFERVIEVEVSNLTSQEIGIPGTSYRLSGVDASGKQWSYPCPLDQLLSVSVAIARYQKLQQLLQQKYELEKGRFG